MWTTYVDIGTTDPRNFALYRMPLEPRVGQVMKVESELPPVDMGLFRNLSEWDVWALIGVEDGDVIWDGGRGGCDSGVWRIGPSMFSFPSLLQKRCSTQTVPNKPCLWLLNFTLLFPISTSSLLPYLAPS